ncbi:c-type cytochrome [Roseateles toxinivorans]|uniref:Cytochrome c553 n=1 Tax=Roseateles toxinivorans TaxID=270368 RepID=A0A4R6QNV6_9BURK|nr:cytochrome C [Roseateles toxinivorans]TDP64171.1 cytochrome c553 [Roseateles toxinivorans]
MISLKTLAPLALATLAGICQAQDANLARNLAATCANCHGTAGIAKGEMKTLAGRKEDELLKLLADYRSGAQPATIMHQIVKGYTEDQLKLVVKHFAALPAKP